MRSLASKPRWSLPIAIFMYNLLDPRPNGALNPIGAFAIVLRRSADRVGNRPFRIQQCHARLGAGEILENRLAMLDCHAVDPFAALNQIDCEWAWAMSRGINPAPG